MNENTAKCFTCKHRVEVQLPPPTIGRQSLCYFLPPTPCVAFMATPGGGIGVAAQVTARPVVRDDDLCGQWEAAPALSLLPAND
jgi:hypothetical protein